jgi:large subunit ribosomal protein L10
MALTKAKKTEVLSKAKDIAKNPSVIFANFHGLTVAQVTELRNELRKENIGYTVAKKTLVRKAFEEAGVKGDMPELLGELALAYSEDLVAPARAIFHFQKKFDKRVSIMGGVFEGVFKTREEMEEIALIPSLQVLRGMFVNIINSPIQGMVLAINAIAEKKGSN